MLVVGAFFAIGGGQELAADDNADAIIRDGIIHSANGGNFADFRHQYQSRLLFALDGVLARQAEKAIADNFAAVKKADVQLQTPLGNRQAQIGINVIGAFAESQNSAFGWQVRAFGGKDNIGGANAGIFFRRVDGEILYGINTFADYESGKYGDFLRYGIGGELQSPYAAFAANYYLPITDDKRQGANVAFSQKGYDANLRINIPQMDYLKLRGDYYYFDGKYGGKDDKGFRYGLEVQPISDLRIGVFYDDGGEKFGGDIVYVYNFGIPQKRESTADFSPDLFSPVLREYSQRIMTAQLGPQLRFITTAISVMTATMITPERAFTTAITMVGMTTTTRNVIMTMTASRMASVHFVARIGDFEFFVNNMETDFTLLVSTNIKFLLTLPPHPRMNPLVITITNNLTRVSNRVSQSDFIALEDTLGIITVGQTIRIEGNTRPRIMTIVEGSEDFISVAITLTMTTKMTAADVITETPMTITGMTTTTRLTFFATSTMTIGAEITTGAAKVDSHFPPSFPPSSFPQVPKLALAENQRPQLSFPRRRESIRRRAANVAAAKPPVIRRGFWWE